MFGNRHFGFRADPTAPAFHRKDVRCFGCLLIHLLAQLIHGIAEEVGQQHLSAVV